MCITNYLGLPASPGTTQVPLAGAWQALHLPWVMPPAQLAPGKCITLNNPTDHSQPGHWVSISTPKNPKHSTHLLFPDCKLMWGFRPAKLLKDAQNSAINHVDKVAKVFNPSSTQIFNFFFSCVMKVPFAMIKTQPVLLTFGEDV